MIYVVQWESTKARKEGKNWWIYQNELDLLVSRHDINILGLMYGPDGDGVYNDRDEQSIS